MGLLRTHSLALLLGCLALAMTVPSLFAAAARDWPVARVFLYCALFTGVAAAILAFALRPGSDRDSARHELGVLFIAWLVLPAFAALPLVFLTPALGRPGAYFEMIAAFTTTGGSAYGDLASVPDAIHLWRGLMGWLGGFLTLIAAYVVLAPRRLGGFEIEAATWRHQSRRDQAVLGSAVMGFEPRILRAMRVILPVYAGLTVALGLLLSATGQDELSAVVHAMAVMSTSGISPHAEGLSAVAVPAAEVLVAVFLVLAATGLLYGRASSVGAQRFWRRDPEIGMMAALVLLFTAALYLRHWIGALTLEVEAGGVDQIEALWGTIFTVLSFLTTTGFESTAWESARDWSGLANPGLFLLALAAIGGGAATTAGGIKLIRAYALIRHGLREIERIAQPSGVLGVGGRTRSLLREGPLIVWSFIMLFILAIMLTILGLTATGMPFQEAMIAAIAAIANTGPAFQMVAASGRGFADLHAPQQIILAGAMVVGRFETLALIALVNPAAWPGRKKLSERAGKTW